MMNRLVDLPSEDDLRCAEDRNELREWIVRQMGVIIIHECFTHEIAACAEYNDVLEFALLVREKIIEYNTHGWS